jgi:hypothetical protein
MGYLSNNDYRKLGFPIGILSASGDNYTYGEINELSADLIAVGSGLSATGSILNSQLNQLDSKIFSGIQSPEVLITGNSWYSGIGNISLNRSWAAIDSSLDGSYVLATVENGTSGVFESFNSGKNFTYLNLRPNALSFKQQGVAVSDDGTVAIAAHSTGLFIKRNGTWNSTLAGSSTTNRWYAADISSDGKYMVATQEFNTSGSIWMSSDSGVSWSLKLNRTGLQFGSPEALAPEFRTVSISDDAKYQLVANYVNDIFISNNSGNSWTSITDENVPIGSWYDSAISANGKHMMLGRVSSFPPQILWQSNDYGITWESTPNPDPDRINIAYGVSMSKNAKTRAFVALNENGTQTNIYLSYDSGNSWTRETGTIVNQYKIFTSVSDRLVSVNTSFNNLWFKSYLNQSAGDILPRNQDIVYTKYNQTISGNKNFDTRPTVNNTGVLLQGEATAANVENVVYTTGNQTISGQKTFAAQNYIFSGVNLTLKNNTLLTSEIGSTGIFNSVNTFTANNTFEASSQNTFKGDTIFSGTTTYFAGFPYFRYPSVGFSSDPNLGSEEWFHEFIPDQNGDITFQYSSGITTFSEVRTNFKEENLINATGITLTISGVSYPIRKILPVVINNTSYRIPLF